MNFVAFFSYVFLTTITPGPNNIVSMSTANLYGLRKGMAFVFGTFLGLIIIMLSAATFSSILYEKMPVAKKILPIIGAGYLLYLAYHTWRNQPSKEREIPSSKNLIGKGFLLQFVNVKVILYAITIWSTYILPFYSDFTVLAAFFVFLILAGTTAVSIWAVLGSSLKVFMSKYEKQVNIVMVLGLLYCALAVLMTAFGS
ncbi:LysE family transporter [Peptoniphilus sp. KCTC 25270]|uniref:LysE family transporter n=1 Tax=Peptoniphilus sp. KCTC 25270 TaxID=2897414 RepID=UPI001E29E3EF|nr:LysE family transporter [Peptoniphilus sp. KCTC 25270]MCD1146527.1 LysE family transporter [Peptoniphilus sp. KCTC 25270]